MLSTDSLQDAINKVCVYTSLNKKGAEALAQYMASDEKPLILFEGVERDSDSKKIFLTDRNLFFITLGMFSAPKVSKIPLSNIQNIVERRGMLLANVDIYVQNLPVFTFGSVQKEASSKLLTTWQMLKDETQKLAISESTSSEKIEKLEALFALKEKGAISEEEYNREKSKILNTQLTAEETAQPIIASLPKQEVKKQDSSFGKSIVGLAIIIVFFIMLTHPSDKDNAKLSNNSAKKTATVTAVNLNTGEVIKPSRKEGSKAFVKTDGTKIFKESELKNSLGELMKGTELRIQEGVASSGNLPVRYKVNVMKAGKIDITGWLTDDALTNPVDLVAQQKKSGAKKSEYKHLPLDDFVSSFNSISSALKDGHSISERGMIFTPGSVNDSYRIKYADCLFLSLFVVHDTSDFVQAFINYGGDKTGDYASHLICLIGELFYATGVINDFSETATLLDRLKFSNLHDGAFNSIIVNGWRVYISYSDITGLMCGVEKP
ncbi:MAG: SHOCT domain-containing protein [Synergistaceae bacterium]|nr:SHOCT domain-containing protein [Synergistaceae bacterium]